MPRKEVKAVSAGGAGGKAKAGSKAKGAAAPPSLTKDQMARANAAKSIAALEETKKAKAEKDRKDAENQAIQIAAYAKFAAAQKQEEAARIKAEKAAQAAANKLAAAEAKAIAVMVAAAKERKAKEEKAAQDFAKYIKAQEKEEEKERERIANEELAAFTKWQKEQAAHKTKVKKVASPLPVVGKKRPLSPVPVKTRVSPKAAKAARVETPPMSESDEEEEEVRPNLDALAKKNAAASLKQAAVAAAKVKAATPSPVKKPAAKVASPKFSPPAALTKDQQAKLNAEKALASAPKWPRSPPASPSQLSRKDVDNLATRNALKAIGNKGKSKKVAEKKEEKSKCTIA